MEIKIRREDFLMGLGLAQSIADRKGTMPVLANALLRTEGKDTVQCAATDLRVSVVSESPAEVRQEGGVSIGAKHLYEIVRSMPSETIELRRTENNWVEIRGGKAHYQLVGTSDRDFPRLPEHQDLAFFEVDAAALCGMIAKTQFSISTDDTRRHLSGIFLEWEGEVVRMVSTDGHRLSLVEAKLGEGPALPEGVIVPRKGLLEMRRLLESLEGTCDVAFSSGNLVVRGKDVLLTIKLVDAKFPPYKQVVPESSEKRVLLSRAVFLGALKRIAIVSSDRNRGIHLELTPGQLRIRSDNPDLGEAHEDLDVAYDGEALSIGFDSRYFLDILGEIAEEEVALELSGELDPGVVKPVGNEELTYLGVIMPMRI